MLEVDRIRFENARPLRASEYMRLVDAGVFDGENLELLGVLRPTRHRRLAIAVNEILPPKRRGPRH